MHACIHLSTCSKPTASCTMSTHTHVYCSNWSLIIHCTVCFTDANSAAHALMKLPYIWYIWFSKTDYLRDKCSLAFVGTDASAASHYCVCCEQICIRKFLASKEVCWYQIYTIVLCSKAQSSVCYCSCSSSSSSTLTLCCHE
jgi:hypothetical protein